MADAARIILQAGLSYRITDAGKETITMELLFPESSAYVKQRIEQLINDYNFFRYGDNE